MLTQLLDCIMPFEEIIGQSRIKKLFESAVKNGRLSHAYLFVGPHGVGKEAAALELCRLMLQAGDTEHKDDPRVRNLSHPDVHVVFPSPAKLKEEERTSVINSIVADPYQRLEPWAKPTISIDRIREIRRTASFKSYEGQGRVFLLYDCDRLTIEASNSLLKILEEPPDKMYLIMTSSKPSMLLPTITSRCQLVKFGPLPATDIEQALITRKSVEAARARLLAQLADGSYRQALQLMDEELTKMQELALGFFRQSVQNDFKQLLYVDQLLSTFQRDLKSLRHLLSHVLIWVRDVLVYREQDTLEKRHLIHSEQTEVLKKFIEGFPQADLHAVARELEQAFELMERNVQINLILIVLLNRLRKLIKG